MERIAITLTAASQVLEKTPPDLAFYHSKK